MKWILLFVSFFLAGALFFTACSSSTPPTSGGTSGSTPSPSAGAVSFDWDKGPTEVDSQVAKDPKDVQDTYNNIIKVKCTQCHPLSRALYSPYYDQQTWTKIVTKMANRPGSQVDPADVDKIVKFMVYDHNQRKADIEKMFTDNHWAKKDPIAL